MRKLLAILLVSLMSPVLAADGNRLTYLDGSDPYYPSRNFPKLITPQWVGEEGVEAVIVLAIDDMRGHEKWEAYLRPILERLKQIDGRAPVSIMTCVIDPKDEHLQKWLKEGLSLEVHTIDHPCPILKDGSLEKARSTYDRCVDLMNAVAGNKPVAFRTPCCDSLNTPSPRFFAEIFNKTTERGHFLTIDSSVFNITTANDPELPRELVLEKDGRERFRKYLPFDSFVNTIEDYPYPYVIGKLCWEFPCAVPSDWEAQNLNKPNSEKTVEDLKAAIDATVIKKGVFNFVFHPHGWIRNTQVVEIIDHVVAKHGKKVKFLTFAEAQKRIDQNMLAGQPLRDSHGADNGVRVLDINHDGYMDVLIGNPAARETRIWDAQKNRWTIGEMPVLLMRETVRGMEDNGVRFGVLTESGMASMMISNGVQTAIYDFSNGGWGWSESSVADLPLTSNDGRDTGTRLRDIDRDGMSELITPGTDGFRVAAWNGRQKRWEDQQRSHSPANVVDAQGRDAGLRFVDLNEDGFDDVIVSNASTSGVHLFEPKEKSWRRTADVTLPQIIRPDGTNNGVWFHSRHMWVQNEDTARLPNLVDRRTFAQLRGPGWPEAKSPEASLKSINVKPGFEIELVAAEPLVMDPVSFAWGPDGKFWVVEMGDYPNGVDGKGKPGGKVRYLEDLDGDGKYDKSTLFLEDLNCPTGLFPWGKGIIVTVSPDIFYAEDTNGDGKADQRENLFTGFTPGNQQHRVNGPTYGLDNWLYYANGHEGGNVKSVKTGQQVAMGSRDLRVRPDTGQMEPELGPTQFYRAQDDWGNWFGNDNSNPMYQFLLSDRYLRRNPHFAPPSMRVPVPKIPSVGPVFPISTTLERFNDPFAINRFTSACSTIVYRDDLLGENFYGNMFVCEPVHNLVNRQVMTQKGLTFTSDRAPGEDKSEFISSSDNWFRPVSVRTGPDGALWIADMYRLVIEHPQWIPRDWQARLDLRSGHDKGRIYRVYPVGRKPRAIPRLDKLTTEQLVAALDSPNGTQRDMVQQLIVQQKKMDAAPLLKKMVLESQRPLARLHALCSLEGLGALDGSTVLHALKDAEPGVRRHAIRVSEPLLSGSSVGQALIALVSDSDPHVRLQLACTLGEWNDPRAGAALAQLAVKDASDRFISAAVMSSVNARNLDAIVSAVTAADAAAAPPGVLENLLRVGAAMKNTKAVALALTAASRDGDQRGFSGLATLLEALEQSGEMRARLSAESPEAVARVDAAVAQARKVVSDSTGDTAVRAGAVRLIGKGFSSQQEDQQLLASLLTPQSPPEIQSAAAANLALRKDAESAVLLLKNWKGYGQSVRAQVIDAFLNRAEWVDPLLRAIESGTVLPADFDATRRQRLLQHRLARVRERAQNVFAEVVNPDRQKTLDQYKDALTLKGDPARGAEVFTKTCATCHKLGEAGYHVGPDLAATTGKPSDWMLMQIIDPNRALDGRYVNYVIDTKSGLNLSGVLTAETGGSVTLLAANGEVHEVLRSDLLKLRSMGISLMPEGLESGYSPQDLADLIAFIQSRQKPRERKVFAGNEPGLVKAGERGMLRLTPPDAEIYGPTIALERQYTNLGLWHNSDDSAEWTIDVPEDGKYFVWIEWACADEAAGNQYVIEAGNARLNGRVASTGTWDVYRKSRVGEIELKKGTQRVIVRPDGKINGELMDLKEVQLVPPNKY